MKWSLLELKKYRETPLVFDEILILKDELISRDDQILDLAPVQVNGLVTVGKEYVVHYTVTTVITLPSSRSLEPVEVPLHFTVDEVFMTPEQYQLRDVAISEEEILLLESQTLNLKESVADNILLAIPLKVLTKEEEHSDSMPSGADWEVLSEEDYQRQKELQANQIDPRLAKLSQLLNDNEDDNA